MILDRASVESMNEAGYARLNILEAVRDIRSNVEGQEKLALNIERGTANDSTSKEDIERTAAADDAEKKESPEASKVDDESPASVMGQTAANTPGAEVTSPNENANMTDDEQKRDETATEHTAPDGKEVPGVDADDPTKNPTETLGGNPVGTLTGEEDEETLQRKADEEARANGETV